MERFGLDESKSHPCSFCARRSSYDIYSLHEPDSFVRWIRWDNGKRHVVVDRIGLDAVWFHIAPPGRTLASISTDVVRGQPVLFGGLDSLGNSLADTWTWTSSDGWSQASPANAPPARGGAGQVWDPLRQLTVLFGGSNSGTAGGLNDTWLWNGGNWTQESTPASPTGRLNFGMAYDIQHQNAVIFSGSSSGTSLNETWTLGLVSSSGWVNETGMFGTPGARYFSAAADLPSPSETFVMFGGTDGTNVNQQTWAWFGGLWSTIVGSAVPAARHSAAMAGDALHNNAVLFGGIDDSSATVSSNNGSALFYSDTWLFDPSTGQWAKQTPAASPSMRAGAALVFDSVQGISVLFGGTNGSSSLSETWQWDGTNWTELNPAASPSARAYASMVYDVANSQIVLFGGSNSGTYLNDTWAWNGTTWTRLSPATSPPARDAAAMVYDAVHGRTLLFGGRNTTGALGDMWQWDGVNWAQITPPGNTPGARYGAAAGFYGTKDQFLLPCGFTTAASNEEWMWISPYLASVTLPTDFFNLSYSDQLDPAGGVSPYTVSQTGVPLAFSSIGLTLSSTGSISGTSIEVPGQTISLGATIQDAQGQMTEVVFLLPADNPITFQPSPPDAISGVTYNFTLSAGGGTPPYEFLASGLPAGLLLGVENTITGKCTAGSTNVMLSVIDAVNGTVTLGPLTIHCNTNTITFAPLPNHTYGDLPFMISATSTSNQPVGFGATGNCTVAASTVTITGAGSCTITALLTGAVSVPQTFQIAKATLTVAAKNVSRPYGTANPQFTAMISGFVYRDTQSVVSGTPSFTTMATLSSLPGPYPITAALGTLAAANYTFNLQPGTLTVSFTASIPTSGNTCNGAYNGTLAATLNVSRGQTCIFVNGAIKGNVAQSGGTLILNATAVTGNLTTSGGSLTIGPSSTVKGNLAASNLSAGSGPVAICGAQVNGNAAFDNDASSIEIGSSSASCPGNRFLNNLEVSKNAAAVQAIDNTVGGNMSVNSDVGATQVLGNAVTGTLQCMSDTALVIGGPNPGSPRIQGQCYQY